MKPHEMMPWQAMADECFFRAAYRSPIHRKQNAWKGFWSLVKNDGRFWGMIGYSLHDYNREAKETKHALTQHLPTPSRMWNRPIQHLKKLSLWCSLRSEKHFNPSTNQTPT